MDRIHIPALVFALVCSFAAAVPAFGRDAPAVAQTLSIEIPAPSDFGLFAIGVIGLIVARYAAKKRKQDD